jgi:hypothetical protein
VHVRTLGRLRAGGSGFSPASVFAGGAAGIWLDQSDLSTGFQLSSGASPQTASGQPTGTRLDRRLPQGASESVSMLAADWTPNANASVSNNAEGQLVVTSSGISAVAQKTLPALSGEWYELTITIGAGNTKNLRVGSSAGGAQYGQAIGEGVSRVQFQTSGTSIFLTCFCGDTPGNATAYGPVALRHIPGNHVLQATTSARPTYEEGGEVAFDMFDGTDDAYSTATFSAGTLTADMDCFIAVRRADSADGVPVRQGLSFIFGCWQTSASRPDVSSGTPTYAVDGVDVAATRTALKTALTEAEWHILEVRNLDLSGWSQLSISGYTALFVSGDIGGVILCPAQDDATRTNIRRWLGAKVDLSL